MLAVDYSQVELRIVAHISGDEAMLDAFRAGQDIQILNNRPIHRPSALGPAVGNLAVVETPILFGGPAAAR